MAHPDLALGDPFYWLALLALIATIPALFLALRPSRSAWNIGIAIAMLVLCLPSGCYALIGSACYVSGDCL